MNINRLKELSGINEADKSSIELDELIAQIDSLRCNCISSTDSFEGTNGNYHFPVSLADAEDIADVTRLTNLYKLVRQYDNLAFTSVHSQRMNSVLTWYKR